MGVKRILGAGLVSVGLVGGLASYAGAQSNFTIRDTARGSHNTASQYTVRTTHVNNDNHVAVDNDNVQTAYTGAAKVQHNRSAGDARTGNAANTNAFNAAVEVKNTMPPAAVSMPAAGSATGSISDTGRNSTNTVRTVDRSYVTVDNDNHVYVNNDNDQLAQSGNATVSHNRDGGDATSGNATNTNTTTVSVKVSN